MGQRVRVSGYPLSSRAPSCGARHTDFSTFWHELMRHGLQLLLCERGFQLRATFLKFFSLFYLLPATGSSICSRRVRCRPWKRFHQFVCVCVFSSSDVDEKQHVCTCFYLSTGHSVFSDEPLKSKFQNELSKHLNTFMNVYSSMCAACESWQFSLRFAEMRPHYSCARFFLRIASRVRTARLFLSLFAGQGLTCDGGWSWSCN